MKYHLKAFINDNILSLFQKDREKDSDNNQPDVHVRTTSGNLTPGFFGLALGISIAGGFAQGFLGSNPQTNSGGNDVISLSIELNQEYYLPKEAIPVTLKLTNFSGQTLKLGKTPTWISFEIENGEGRPIVQERLIDTSGEFELDTALRAKKVVNVAEGFELADPGFYKITAFAEVPGWGRITSPPEKFQVLSGIVYWNRMFGVPGEDADQSAEVRRYSLVQAVYLKERKLYVRVDSVTHSKVLEVFPIGPMVSLSRPAPQLDRWNNLHVLYQIGRDSFVYNVISPAGEHLRRKYYLRHPLNFTRPQMYPDNQGRIFVYGGQAQVRSDDIEHETAPPAYPENLQSKDEKKGSPEPTANSGSSTTKQDN